MDAIKSAIKLLENTSTVTSGEHQDAVTAIAHLRSAIKLYDLQILSSSALRELSDLLRQSLSPLYRDAFRSALEYAAAVFHFIYQNRILPYSGSKEQVQKWENVLISLFSGILDFLEEFSIEKQSSNSAYGKTAASTFSPELCEVFFRPLSGHGVDFDGDLSSVVYQLLRMTVELHSPNATRLREDIGGKRLGISISRTKAMESLLELFAVLVPSAQGGRTKRRNFITAVFDSSIFSCSDQIIKCLESLTSSDWTITGSAIVNALAESDISFPQPFDICNLAVNNELLHQASSFHVDKSQFIANLEKDGQIETFHVPFSTVRKIHNCPLDNDEAEVHILIEITRPAILGDKPIEVASMEDMTVSLNLKKSLLKRFEKALKGRSLVTPFGVNFATIVTRKQSKAEGIKLDFLSRERSSGMVKHEKLQSISQLWTNDAVPTGNEPSDPLATSPLILRSASSQIGHLPLIPTKQGVNPTRDNGGSWVDASKGFDQPSDDENPQPKSKYAKSTRKVIICSDDEDSPDKQISSHFEDVEAVKVKRMLLLHNTNRSGSVKFADVLLGGLHAEGENVNHKQSFVDLFLVKESKKRSASIDDSGADAHNVKRLRRDVLDISPIAAATHVKQMKRYTRKGRTSSPTIDFDELPQSEVSKSLAKRVAIKGSHIQTKQRHDPDITLVDTKDKPVQSLTTNRPEDAKERRRSARVAMPEKLTTVKRAQKAPWEKKEFLETKASKPVAVYPDSNEEILTKSEDTPIKTSEDLSHGNTVVGKNSETYTDFVVPLKSAPSSSDYPPVNPDTNVITIDLTQDESPTAPPISRKASMVLGKSIMPLSSRDEGKPPSDSKLSRPTDVKPKVEKVTSFQFETDAIKNPYSLPRGKPKAAKVGPTSFSPPIKEGEIEKFNVKYADRVLRNASETWCKAESFIQSNRDALRSPLSNRESKLKSSAGFVLPDFDDLSQHTEKKEQTREQGILAAHIYFRSGAYGQQRQQEYEQKSRIFGSGTMPEVPLQKIVKAVIEKVYRRFDDVTEELHTGQRAILEATAGIAKEMCNTSASHFNDMIDLEADYISQREKITRGLHNYLKSTDQVSVCFKDIINQHNNRSLSRKFPAKLFDKVPAIIKDPTIKL
ncbi:hypothetical protein CPB84DRAFT_1853541 [Gymnopilus junonius]|uniref:Uncharacterized protein n=1 Tax=Gymnopilus junonius TaxID=109634 RepID=A0A9P5TFJ2_GYMJU|nr:hypothetical protein CPB84DRAFT_1853541 [Gymnopilus junonius]